MTTADQATHGLARRLAERFALIAFGLYHLPLFLNNYPSLGGGGFGEGLAVSWGHIFTRPGIWLARILFHMPGPMPGASDGDNGDVGEEFARLILAVAIGVVAAIGWTIADRKRPQPRWTEGALRVLLRYSIALGLISYAIAKILPQQFPPLTAFNYETRVGELAPMRLLWHFMQYSRPYNFFGGLMECVAIAFLCFRRTATLGALVTIAVMTNVALMNYAYDVPVKLYATMMVVSASVLALYDAKRLLAVFVTNRTAEASPQPTLLEGRMPGALRWAIKIALVGSVTVSSIVAFQGLSRARVTPTAGIAGAWGVTSFMRDANATDATAGPTWRRIIVDNNSIAVRLENDAMLRCRLATPLEASAAAATIAFSCGRNRTGELRWTVLGTELQLDGTLAGVKTTMTARRLDEKDYPLMRGGFRLIFDRQ